jgi:hypothetical protein
LALTRCSCAMNAAARATRVRASSSITSLWCRTGAARASRWARHVRRFVGSAFVQLAAAWLRKRRFPAVRSNDEESSRSSRGLHGTLSTGDARFGLPPPARRLLRGLPPSRSSASAGGQHHFASRSYQQRPLVVQDRPPISALPVTPPQAARRASFR